ncbi:hypothetical protein RvY_11660 [Ramazzottius varieornatus]|uniref:Uncharacterized protein n=1 Tax=Ramazzottius varieornatus TaxID=947166 RepID=A0A1D1VGX1_RAMVA|nr:hypothetical protein RvY_11660 [Ramazzottius varieornatus]
MELRRGRPSKKRRLEGLEKEVGEVNLIDLIEPTGCAPTDAGSTLTNQQSIVSEFSDFIHVFLEAGVEDAAELVSDSVTVDFFTLNDLFGYKPPVEQNMGCLL